MFFVYKYQKIINFTYYPGNGKYLFIKVKLCIQK